MKKLIPSFFLLFVIVQISVAQNQSPTVTATKLSENLYQFFTNFPNKEQSVNTFAFSGSDGILLVDAGFPGAAGQIREELKRITDKKIRFLINTHYHGDHTFANGALGADATILAQQDCRTVLERHPGFAVEGLPSVTFHDSLTLWFNGEEIQLTHIPGHTGTDIIIYFKHANIVFLGDLIFPESFPLVEYDGSVYLLEKNLKKLSEMFTPDTRMLVSHGRELRRSDLKDYVNMVIQTHQIVLAAIKKGLSPEEAKKSDLLKDWKAYNSKLFPSGLNTDSWIDNLYLVLEEGRALSASKILKSTYEKSGMEAMKKKYREVCVLRKPKMYILESEMNDWGYALLKDQKILDAVEVFRINTEAFPQSANAFDSLGEAFMISGNKELAIQNYEISLKLNPRNTNAVEQLKKLKE